MHVLQENYAAAVRSYAYDYAPSSEVRDYAIELIRYLSKHTGCWVLCDLLGYVFSFINNS